MLIKLAGGALVFYAGLFWGIFKSGELSKREKSLRDIRTALNVLESEIVFSSHYLKHAFMKISEICSCGALFSDTAEKMEEDGILKAWEYAVEKNKKKLVLKNSDAEIIKILGSQLGMSDREQQVKNIRHVDALLGQALEEAREEYHKSAKLYRSMGILGGLFIIILLL